MPLWGFILLVFLLLCIVVAAVVVPLEFFVFKNLPLGNNKSDSALQQCEESLSCLNGGTSVVSQGECSCICTNGFTGSDCGVSGASACTTTNLVSTDGSSNIDDVTLGKAIPRLIADAKTNFTIPLSGTAILAKFSSSDLSCIGQNSLVTFQGRATRYGQTSAEIDDITDAVANAALVGGEEDFVSVSVITITPGTHTTLTLNHGAYGVGLPTQTSESESTSEVLAIDTSVPSATEPPSGNRGTASTTAAEPTATFAVTEEVLDFARVAVLYVLQEEGTDAAETAQTDLQGFFTKVSEGAVGDDEAASLNFGGDNVIDLVDFTVNVGDGPVGSRATKRDAPFFAHDTRQRLAPLWGSLPKQ